jgi:thiamine kinase-like enzyme
MLTLFNRKNSKLQESEKEKINQCLLSFMNSTTMILDLPLVNHALKAELEKNAYATLREVAAERVLIYRRTIAPSHLFSHETPDSFQYKRLSGGYSNCTFQIKMSDDAAYISRIPGNGSELFIDRPAEFHNATLAAQLGLNPEVKYNDGIKGKQLSVCLAAPQPLTPELMQSNPRYLTEIAVQLRTLHASKKQFANEANIFKRNEGFHEILAKSEIVLPAAYARIQSVTQHMRVIFANLNIQMVPCHNDTFFNNFLLSDGRLWLIDWEYSGNHDAMWDLSYFAKLANLSEAPTPVDNLFFLFGFQKYLFSRISAIDCLQADY